MTTTGYMGPDSNTAAAQSTREPTHVEPADVSDYAEQRLRELIRAGNVDAIRLALSLRTKTYEVTC